MLTVGQEVSTRYGPGIVVRVGRVHPNVYVRLHSTLQLYVSNGSQILIAESRHAQVSSPEENIKQEIEAKKIDYLDQGDAERVVLPRSDHLRDRWRRQMKNVRSGEQTPLAVFVRDRLAELGMKQSEFCRLTGFDQGLLSKIQSSLVTNLSLETALRLAVGLSVPPEEVLVLIDREDLLTLVSQAYPQALAHAPLTDAEGIPVPVLEVNRLALRAYGLGRSLAPVIGVLSHLATMRGDKPNGQSKLKVAT